VRGGWWSDAKSLEINEVNLWKTLDSKTLSNHYVVEFFSESCKFCKDFKPDWDKLAEEFNENTDITIATMNCNKMGKVCKKYGIRSYPSLVYITPSKGSNF